MQHSGPLVSIIIPVYNTEQYLRECLDSILNQVYSHLEVLLVDDGSTDASGRICDEYAGADSRVSVIHQRNGGHTVARTTGLRNATGDVVMWLDSDDWVNDTWVATYTNAMVTSNADIVMTGTEQELLRHPLGERDFLLARLDHTMWASCAKRSLYNGLSFENVTIGEDVLMLQNILWRAQLVQVIHDHNDYHYREVPTSISRVQSIANKKDWPARAQKEIDFTHEHCPEYIDCAYFDVMRGATVVYKTVKSMNVDESEKSLLKTVKKQLRHLMRQGLIHLPLQYMKMREFKQVLRTVKNLIL